ncbi:hypothetical protein [Ruania zhangjianzhongii]|uniref:hypothetical protein n=1 Tax=Ruania zhangjianzhongii TaxID=2603206 RepID=UPI0011CB02F4|nr:hypothetical protein [Ruania zhangjianzhongii]
MTACSPSPIDPTEDCTDAGSQPAGEPGSAEVLLTSSGYVLYADGWMVITAEDEASAANAMRVPLMAPAPPAGDRWQPAYLGSCQLEAVDALAAEELVEGDLGDPIVTDASTTTITYYGGEEPVSSSAYALGSESSDLSRADQQGREVLKALIAALDEATVTGDVLPVETVRVNGEVGEPEPEGWPGPPLAELLGDDGCGELTGQQALDVYEYLGERTHADVGWLRVTVVAPGQSACD